jgi:glutamate 5-kinase
LSQLPIVVVKIGTNLLTTGNRRLDLNNLRELVNQICDELDQRRYQVVVVTSGAITCGAERMGFVPESIPEKQAAAAVGQILLMQEYTLFFGTRGYAVGQLLLTKDGLENPIVLQNTQNTLDTLLNHGIVPIVNENDSVATNEIGPKFGDNDELSAVVSRLVNASRLILLTDIDGLFTDNPKENSEAVLISGLEKITDDILEMARDRHNGRSRGGMRSKLKAAREASENGTEVIIANGRKPGIIESIQLGNPEGTKVAAQCDQ